MSGNQVINLDSKVAAGLIKCKVTMITKEAQCAQRTDHFVIVVFFFVVIVTLHFFNFSRDLIHKLTSRD